jgi:branched-chain amino acid transport system ATP-binding protein
VLEVSNINAQYGETRVLYDVSMSVEKARLISVVGSNGAGKSTILKVISGILKPVSGYVRFEGTDTISLKSYEIVERGISYIPEGRKIFSRMNIMENLFVGSFVPRARAVREKTMKRVFEIFPILYERKGQIAGSLSGGQQQMLAIARGLMSNPRLLMLDEPSLGLAPLVRREIFHILPLLQKEGLTILLVDQNLNISLEISDYSYVIENGRIVMEGTGRQLMADEHTKRAYMGL